MKKEILLFKALLILLSFTFFRVTIYSQIAVLKHSYTFDDGTAKDVIGNANGTLNGGTIQDGVYIATASGQYITLPADIIKINTYQAVTFEAFIISSESAPRNAMLYYFGGSINNNGAYGTFLTPNHWRGNGNTVAAISTVSENQPWTTETYVQSTNSLTMNGKHHAVVILTSTEIILYIDGKRIGSGLLATQGNSISALSNDYAWIGKGGYTNDPTWIGKLDAFNIYEGVLDEATIQQHYLDFMGSDFFDARLSSLTTNTSKLEPEFNPDIDMYEIKVDYGITSLKLSAIPKVIGATVKMSDGLGNAITDGNVSFDIQEGVDIQIIVTALDKSTQKAYYVSVIVNPGENSANLANINISKGKILNTIHPDTLTYSVLVPNGTTSIEVTGTPCWPGATVSGGGNVVINDGFASTTLTVTSEDGKKIKNYKVNIYESNIVTGKYYYIKKENTDFVIEESGEQYNVIKLGAPIKDNDYQLFEFIETEIPGEYYIRNKASKYLALGPTNKRDLIMRSDLTQNTDSCKFKINEFSPGRFRIESVIKSSSNEKYMGTNSIYYGSTVYGDKTESDPLNVWNIVLPEILIPYNTYLSDLKVSPDTINPVFVFYQKDYYVIVPEGRTSLEINATASDPSAIIEGTGTVNLTGDRGIIVVKVSSPDGKYSTDYRIHYFVNGPLTLRHSYTFANGTAMDMVGNAHGTVNGGIIKDGMYIASKNGHHISFPGDIIDINSYPSITIETYTLDDDALANDYNTMVTYFGNTQGNYGTDYIFTSLKSRAAISCKNASSPWSAESGVSGTNLLDDPKLHHLVGIITYDSIYLYIDGKRINASAVSNNNKIYNLSTRYAYLCKSGYLADKTWIGKVLEFNIYSGVMDTATISARAKNIPMEDSTKDATLSMIKVNGVLVKDFVSYKLNYKILLPYGTNIVPEILATPKCSNATVNIIPVATLNDTAKIEVTAADGITKVTYRLTFEIDESIIIIDNVKNFENNYSIKVFPTLFDDQIKIESSVEMKAINVFDVSGKLVYSKVGKMYEHIINKNFERGIYIIKINHENGVKIFKVVKKS